MRNCQFIIVFLLVLNVKAQPINKAKLTDSLTHILNQAFHYSEIKHNDSLALKNIIKAEHLYRKYPNLKTDFFLTTSHLIRARALYNLGNFEKSERYINHGLKYANKTQSIILTSYLFYLKGNVFLSQSKFDKANKFYSKALQELDNPCSKVDNKITVLNIDVHKIDIYYALADCNYKSLIHWRFNNKQLDDNQLKINLNKAVEYGKNVLYYIDLTNQRLSREMFAHIVMAEGYTGLKKYELAKKHLDSVNLKIKFTDNLNNFRLQYAYGNYYSKTNKKEKAKNAYKKAYQFSRKYTDENFKRFQNRLKHEIEYLTHGLKGELMQTALDLLKIKKFKNHTTFALIGLILLSLTIVLILQRALLKNKSKSNLKLLQANAQLNKIINHKEELENRIENIQDLIARDLHDNFGNRISGINSAASILMDMRKGKAFDAKEYDKFLNHFNNSVLHLNADIKDLIWANNSKNNLLKEVVFRLEMFVKEFEKTTNCKVYFTKHIAERVILPRFWNRQILLIFKEAINNACKHAKSERIELIIKTEKNNLEIKLKDNGKGFNMNNLQRISGVDNMKKRATSINCSLIVNSVIGKGTEITFKGEILN